ncbi:S8 family serine peptidase [Micromonospora sp. NPDC049523]|uniref:S8 family serine peptidase n=1 Tax=Micromonospora sp. NPDC049523 TaxID=3155921 RepID=UPI00342F973A
MGRFRGRTPRWVCGAAIGLSALLALPTGAVAAPPVSAAPASAPDANRKVDMPVLRSLSDGSSTTFLVRLADEAKLDEAELARVERGTAGRAGRVARTTKVYQTKVAHAEKTQRGLRTLLRERGSSFTPYWIANAIEVTGNLSLVTELAARPEVARISPVGVTRLTDPVKTAGSTTTAGALPWNLTQLGADKVWDSYGVRGEGIVVGSIDTGVQYDHPALVRQYRGNNGDGSFTHDYNWFDPTGLCGGSTPCDNYGHGTHTVGTVLGDDGAGTVTGVAPGAKWIAAKGCEINTCSDSALLAAGQWMVAPTDHNGQNPRPDLAPDVINNSWGGADDGNHFYEEILTTWAAAGIFPSFSAGNEGRAGCGTAGYPGTSPLAYAVGATDSTGTIADFSSRGPARDGVIRPDITAPGVGIVSSLPGSQYGSADGTSMASPHLTGAIALLWSAVPNLRRDVATTRELLDRTAHDVEDLSCGGTAADNGVYGEGRLDAYALVSQAPAGQVGGVVVTTTRSGGPMPGAKVTLASGVLTRSGHTDGQGRVELGRVPAGEYTLTASVFAQRTQRQTVTVTADGTANATIDLSDSAPWHPVHGIVRDPAGQPAAGATVALAGETFPAFVTGTDGRYSGMLPEADYDVLVDYGRWLAPKTVPLTVDGEETLDVSLAAKTDRHGYAAGVAPAAWVTGGSVLPLTGDEASRAVDLPFAVTFYGQPQRKLTVSSNGYVAFGESGGGDNTALPAPAIPAAAVYAYWDDLVLDHQSTVRTRVTGSAPNRQFLVSWTRAALKKAPQTRVDFQLLLGENGTITLQYRKLGTAGTGAGATVGISDAAGGAALTYSVDAPVLDEATAITFRVPGTGLVRGTVTDANDRQPLAGATVRFTPSGTAPVTATTDADGFYQVEVPTGEVSVGAAKSGYDLPAVTLTVAEAVLQKQDLAMRAPLLLAAKSSVAVTAPTGGTRSVSVNLNNHGGLPANWTAREIDSPTPPVTTPGRVLGSFPIPDLYNAYGVGYRNGELLVSDSYFWGQMQRFDTAGKSLGKGVVTMNGWPSDLAYVPGKDLMCGPSMSIVDPLPIVCFDPDTYEVKQTITGPWAGKLYYGLAYRSADDTFYLAGDGKIQHLAGLSHAEPGAVLGQCVPATPWITGLALNEQRNVLWGINQDSTEAIWAMNPDTCATLGSIPDPDPDPLSGAGIELDDNGDLWLVGQANRQPYRAAVYHVDGSMAYSDVPWLAVTPQSGQVDPGEKGKLDLTVDTTGLAPGTYTATVLVSSDSAKTPTAPITISVTVTPRG